MASITFDREKLCKIIEGKTKIVYQIPDSDLALVKSKAKITAFNAERQHDLEGKARLSTHTNSKVFHFLNTIGVKTHFVEQHSDTEFVAESCKMIPLEWVTRRIATGSFVKRNPGVKEGYRFTPPKMEIFYKDDVTGDPEWSEEMVMEAGLSLGGVRVGEREVELMSQTAVTVFEVLERAWNRLGCTLVDMKIEFGVNSKGEVVVADVIDSDSWRLWPAGDKRLQVDKQFYRDLSSDQITPDALIQLKENFQWVSDKLDGFVTKPQGRVVIFMGSTSDAVGCGEEIKKWCDELGIPVILRVTSAHKTTMDTLKAIARYEGDGVPTVFVCTTGKSNGLGPVTSGNTTCPVINCPPFSPTWTQQDVWSSLRLPSGLGCSTVLSTEGAALSAASCLSLTDHMIWSRLRVRQLASRINLMKADAEANRS